MSNKTELSKVKNFGPVTLPELEAIGFKSVEELQELGAEEVCRKWISYFPERLNANAFLAVVATIEGVVWTKATPGMRGEARRLAAMLRVESSANDVFRVRK